MLNRYPFIACMAALTLLVVSSARSADYEVGGIRLARGPQDQVSVSSEEWAWANGPEFVPAISFTLNSGRFIYVLRHDRNVNGNGMVALCAPTACNWNPAMLTLLLNGKPFSICQKNGETVRTISGETGAVRLSWENETAKVEYTFLLRAGEDRVFMEIALFPKIELTNIRALLSNYPSGFNPTPRHLVVTPSRRLKGAGSLPLDVKCENALFYADESLDPASNPAGEGSCAIVIAPAGLSKANVQIGGYGTSTTLDYASHTRRLRFCFWEFDHRGHAEAEGHFVKTRNEARDAVANDATFAVSFPPEKKKASNLDNRRAAKVSRVSGTPDWDRLPAFHGNFVIPGKAETAAPLQTRIQAAWDATNFYLRVNVQEDRMNSLVAAHSGSDVWMDDCIEVYLNPNFDRVTCCHFIVNAVGEAFGPDTHSTDPTKGWTSRVGRAGNGWWAELTLPLAAFNLSAQPGTAFPFTVCRERRAGGSLECSTWTPPCGFGRPDDFGVVVLGEYADFIKNACMTTRSALAGIDQTAHTLPTTSPVVNNAQQYRQLVEDGQRLLAATVDLKSFVEWTCRWETLTQSVTLTELEYGIRIRQLLSLD